MGFPTLKKRLSNKDKQLSSPTNLSGAGVDGMIADRKKQLG
jgi:hypothetical protein